MAAEAQARGLPSPICLPENYANVANGTWRRLVLQPLRRSGRQCDTAATTGVGGDSWVRFEDSSSALPTEPPRRSTGAACAADGVAWISGWPAEFTAPPPDSYRRAGSLKGDGPQFVEPQDEFWACFEGPVRGRSDSNPPREQPAEPDRQDRWTLGVVWGAWPIHGNDLRAFYAVPSFPQGPAPSRRLVASTSIEGAVLRATRSESIDQIFGGRRPSRGVILGCGDLVVGSEAAFVEQCTELCAAMGNCHYFGMTK